LATISGKHAPHAFILVRYAAQVMIAPAIRQGGRGGISQFGLEIGVEAKIAV